MPGTSDSTNTRGPAPAKPSFPWWLVGILGGGLLIVVGVVAAFFAKGNPLPGLGAFCAQQEPRCREGLVCSENNLCLGAEGFECSSGDECASHECVQGACLTPVSGPGGPCDEDVDCARPTVCEADRCLLPDGLACTDADLCRSGRCERSRCAPRLAPGGTCQENTDCAEPARCLDGRCLLPDGAPCTRAELCDSGRCEKGTCQAPVGLGEPCTTDRNCREPTRCHQGLCLRPDGTECKSAAQCISGHCDNGLCRTVVPPGGQCRQDGDCQFPTRCVQGTCQSRVSAGGFCRDTGECMPPARCSNNLCLLALGTKCGRDTECEMGNCERGVCRRGCTPPCGSGFSCDDGKCRRTIVVPVLRPCTADTDCTAPSVCSSGRCRKPSGEACSINEQCLSGGCVNERCR
ncbi:hypothetical protein [Vitiosangium sp. GDMCC 1.1324]|uniref:hypothetical protein n=1 Tax=Vitiosangium sp. (strain GDMCC 1.1324) TaxID=2138576 RepID=UPI000D3446FB|nr:hypothetical protein [Vitiosangium sp. GDMCC 1.1324]PTL84220.1 hypothetical protein DAT35_12370 [Vitiosangium sp. GDMCC 1.1324]